MKAELILVKLMGVKLMWVKLMWVKLMEVKMMYMMKDENVYNMGLSNIYGFVVLRQF
jgi:hypothetical protein